MTLVIGWLHDGGDCTHPAGGPMTVAKPLEPGSMSVAIGIWIAIQILALRRRYVSIFGAF